MRFDLSALLLRKSQPPQLAAARGKPRKPRSKAILMKEMAREVTKEVVRVFSKNRSPKWREEMKQAIDDDMLLAARAISRRLAKAESDDDIPMSDTLQMFKQLREYQIAEARIGKLDPNKDKGGKPAEEIDNYRASVKAGQEQYAANQANGVAKPEEKPVKLRQDGAPDARADNPGRPPGHGLKKQLEQVRARTEKLQAAEAKPEPGEE